MHVKSSNSLARHVRRVHGKTAEPEHECVECGKKFFEREDLAKHVARHAKQATLPKCETCAKTFGTDKLKVV
jgi:NAD-dependent SIR2 family protein deacetylase